MTVPKSMEGAPGTGCGDVRETTQCFLKINVSVVFFFFIKYSELYCFYFDAVQWGPPAGFLKPTLLNVMVMFKGQMGADSYRAKMAGTL